MKKLRLLSLVLVIVLLVGMVPTFASAESTVKYVKTSNGLSLNVRSSRKTHTTDNIIARLAYGTKVTVLRTYSTGWSYIKWSGSSKRGYVLSKCLSSKKPGTYTKVYKTVYDNERSYVSMRSSMKDHSNNIVKSLRVGTSVQVIETYSGWSKISYGGYTGYLQNKYLK